MEQPKVAVPKFELVEIEESSLTISWQENVPADLELHIRDFPQPWTQAKIVKIPAGTNKYKLDNLRPTATYECKGAFVVNGSLGPFSPTLSADTLEAGCTPKDKKKPWYRRIF